MKRKKTESLGDIKEILRQYALERGASNAVIIESSEVIVDPRVRLKCMIPKCFSSGECAHCPPHGMSARQVKEMVDAFNWGVFFRLKVKSSIIAAENMAESLNSNRFDASGNILNLGANYLLVFSIVKLLEKKARQFGCLSPLGFAAGNCRDAMCFFQPTCQNLMSRRGCRHSGLSSPSLESCGIDAFTMAARAGWDVYPIGGSRNPQQIAHGTLMGLVLAG